MGIFFSHRHPHHHHQRQHVDTISFFIQQQQRKFLRVQNDCDDDVEVFDYFAETKTKKRVVLERVLYFEFFSFPRGGGSSSFTRASGCRDASSSSSSSSSRERRKNSTNYRINSYSGLNKTNNEVYARSMGSYYSRAKTFAENVLEQTMSFTKGKKRVATMMR